MRPLDWKYIELLRKLPETRDKVLPVEDNRPFLEIEEYYSDRDIEQGPRAQH